MIKQSIVILAILWLSGCASLGKGVTEAFLERQQKEDDRLCEIWGGAFAGLKPNLYSQTGKTKVLMIHGVGDHLPGYATEFSQKLAKELGLTVTSKQHKNIRLTSYEDPSKKLGNLRVHRFLSKNRAKELLFYELTWSEITREYKEVLSYDNSGEHSFRRTQINDMMKKFSNDTGPDPIIYLGESRDDILSSFIQSFCWMASGNWEHLPEGQPKPCWAENISPVQNIIDDHFAFVSHSLGSRITIDGLQKVAEILSDSAQAKDRKKQKALARALRDKHIPIYMMSNQLPMLQLGRNLPKVHDRKAEYCLPEGRNYSRRILSETSIIAFSDPNDLLSYAIPQKFIDKYLDSRLCINVTNININVATVFDIFGLGKVANPLDAHIGYDTDDRVVALIAKGIGNNDTAKIVKKRCSWVETID